MKTRTAPKPSRRGQWRSHVGYPGRLATVISERIFELAPHLFHLQAAGRKLTREECGAELRNVSDKLCERAVEARSLKQGP